MYFYLSFMTGSDVLSLFMCFLPVSGAWEHRLIAHVMANIVADNVKENP